MSEASPVGDASHRDGEASADTDSASSDPTTSEPAPSEPTTNHPKRAEPDRPNDAGESTSWFERACAFVRARYMVVDPRTAGIFRIVLGVLLTADAVRHSLEARDLYSNVGVLSNEFHLWRPSSSYQVSFFHAFSTPREVYVCFALGIMCHLLMLVGYRARLFAFLSFVFVTSMDQRIPLVENGGYVVVNLAAFWAAFLPVGQRFGFDAWRKSWRARQEKNAEALNDRRDFAGERKPMVSLLGVIILVNLSLIYFWNVVNKGGWIWRYGHTVHYVLYIKRMVTIIGVWSRFIPEPILSVSDWAVISVEALVCVFIISPAARRYTRPMAMIGMLGLHGTFGIMMRLGPFSWFMIGCSTLLLSPYQFADIERWYCARAPKLELALAKGSALGLAIGRAVSRLDGYERIRFVEADIDALVAVRTQGSDEAWVTDPKRAVASIASALPLGRYVYPVLRTVTLGTPHRLLAWADAHRERIAAFFGLHRPEPADASHPSTTWTVATPPSIDTRERRLVPSLRLRKYCVIACLMFLVVVCAGHAIPEGLGRGHFEPYGSAFANKVDALHAFVTGADADRTVTSMGWAFLAVMATVLVVFWPAPKPKPLLLSDRLHARVFRARELFLTYYAVASLSQTWNENKGIPSEIKFPQPAFIGMLINYPRLFQGWGMFAPNPIQEDGILVVDGYTLDGRHVDPYNGGEPDLDLANRQGDLGISQLRQDYGNRIRLDQNQVYKDEFKTYLLRWQEETGNPNDELVAFDVYWIRDKCPPLGTKTPTDNDPVAIITYRKPGYRRPQEMTPIPPQPKIRSAEQWDARAPAFLPGIKH